MGELIRREAAKVPATFSGERLTASISGQVEIEHYHRYLLAREFCRGRDVIDVAAGEGYGTALLAQVARSAIGIEIDNDAVTAAREEFRRANLSYLQGDARSLPLPDSSFDVAVSFETLEHLAEQDIFLSELRRVLRPGGLLVISTPDAEVYSAIGMPANPFHELELNAAEFEALLKRHFSHAAFASQRALIGSVIFGNSHDLPLRFYERRSDTMIEGSGRLARAPYLIALASDEALPSLPNSVYLYRSDLDTDMQVRITAETEKRSAERLANEMADRADMAEARLADMEQQLTAALERATGAVQRQTSADEVISGLRRGMVEAEQAIFRWRRRLDEADHAMARWKHRMDDAMQSANIALKRAGDDARQSAVQALVLADAVEVRMAEAQQQIAADMIRIREDTEKERRATLAIEELTREVAISEQRAVTTGQRLIAMETSSMWRALRPVRAFGQRFPFLARSLRRGVRLIWWMATLQLLHRYRLWSKYRYIRDASRQLSLSVTADTLPGGTRSFASHDLAVIQPVGMDPSGKAGPSRTSRVIIPSSPEPVVSIIIATYGQAALTLACLQSIADHASNYPIEVIVVDDAYSGTENMQKIWDTVGIKLIRNSANMGFLLSCNHAAQFARGRYIYMLNNDTELRSDSIDALVELLESRPEAGMVGSKLLFPDGLLQEAGCILWTDASGWNYGRGDSPLRPEYNYVREVDYCSGASLMIRRSLFELLEGFEKKLAPAYYEDADLAFRIRARGMKVLYEPRSVVIHHEGMSHGTSLTSGIKLHQVINQAFMTQHWRDTLAEENYVNGEHALRARDRGRKRKVILVVDHYTPEPDRDAGSRSTFGILGSLVDADWIVKFWPHNRGYSSAYTPALEQLGIEVLDHRWPGDLEVWLRQSGNEIDHLMVMRPDIASDILPHIIRHTDAVLSFYGLDLHFARLRRQADLQADPHLLEQSVIMERLERRVWRHFDVVLYPSEEEAMMVRAMSPRTLAHCIVPFFFDIAPIRSVPPARHDILFVAGFAHPPNVDAAIFLVNEIIPRLEREVGPVKVTLAGSNPSEVVQALAGPNVEVTGHVTDKALAELYSRHRVAVVPLRFGAGVKGKVVESLSRGLPLVTTSIGSQGIPGVQAVVPVRDDIAEIVAAVKLLLTDDDVWLSQSAAQIEFARRFFSRKAMQTSILSALEAGSAALLDAA